MVHSPHAFPVLNCQIYPESTSFISWTQKVPLLWRWNIIIRTVWCSLLPSHKLCHLQLVVDRRFTQLLTPVPLIVMSFTQPACCVMVLPPNPTLTVHLFSLLLQCFFQTWFTMWEHWSINWERNVGSNKKAVSIPIFDLTAWKFGFGVKFEDYQYYSSHLFPIVLPHLGWKTVRTQGLWGTSLGYWFVGYDSVRRSSQAVALKNVWDSSSKLDISSLMLWDGNCKLICVVK